MKRLLRLKPIWAFAVYALLDTVCAGMGMGVPFFCILLGFPAGWYIARLVIQENAGIRPMLRKPLRYAIFYSLFTVALMAAIWGMTVPMLFNPSADLANFGIPMILYEPRASFIGWLVLMIFVSPLLQLLATVFGTYVTLSVWAKES